MNSVRQLPEPAKKRAELGLFDPTDRGANVARWRISGYGASITIWTDEEWENLAVRPTDAQYFPCGVWCALRMD